MSEHEKWQAMVAKLERPPDEVVRLMCLGKLFNEFGFEVDQVVDYVVEAGPGYWAEHFLVDGKVDYGKLIEDMRTYLEALDANTG